MREQTTSGDDQHQHERQQSARAATPLRRRAGSLRASTISARRETYDAYYRPIGYTLEHVKRSLVLAREAGVYTSINLLCFPGLIDCEDEVEALVGFLRETGTRLVQLRNLNIDPEVLLVTRSPATWRAAGHARDDRDVAPRGAGGRDRQLQPPREARRAAPAAGAPEPAPLA